LKKLIIAMLFLTLTTVKAYAGTVETFFLYGPTSTLTDTNLNGNFNNIRNTLNGDLDNENVNVSGFRFVEILGSLPAAGIVGRVVFLTTDGTLHYDDGTQFNSVVVFKGTVAQGQIVYHDGTDFVLRDAGPNHYPLVTRGVGDDPEWAQLELASAVTGELPLINGGTDTALVDPGRDGLLYWNNTSNKVAFLNAPITSDTLQFSSIITVDGTWTSPGGVTQIHVAMVGGGGGGGGADGANPGGGGGGGAGCEFMFTTTENTGYVIDIGAAGIGGNTSGGDGTAGAETAFDTGGLDITAAGGSLGSGIGGGGVGGAGGTTTKDAGAAPAAGTSCEVGGAGANKGGGDGGGGGGSMLGQGGAGGSAGGGSAGTFGGGGGGADAASNTGGAGGVGIVKISW